MHLSTRSADCNECSFCPKAVFACETVITETHTPDAETESVLKNSVEEMASCETLPLKQPCIRSDLTFAWASVRSFVWEVSEPVLESNFQTKSI